MDQEVLDARAKLAARFGKTQVGGKGKFLTASHTNFVPNIQSIWELLRDFDIHFCIVLGTQRRTKKVVHHQEVNEDKKLKSTIKKFGMQSLQDIDEVNMFKDDNTVIHLKRPQSKCFKQHFKYYF